MKKITFVTLLVLLCAPICQGQILISLLLGDKLNSDKMEFGLEGGLALTTITDIEQAKMKSGLDLGFYFDIRLKNQWFLHTGVLVKSPMGAKNILPYETGNTDLDKLLTESRVTRKFNYFNVPVLLKYKFDNQINVELGPQLGLLYKAVDEFSVSNDDKDVLLYQNKIIKQANKFDIGITAGAGYRLLRGNGVNLGARYYYGLLNVYKDNTGASQKNSAIYLYAGIPIGIKKPAKTAVN